MKVIGPPESCRRFFEATQYFQNSLGLVWLVDNSRKITESCYEISPSENVKHCHNILRAIAIAAGCHIQGGQ